MEGGFGDFSWMDQGFLKNPVHLLRDSLTTRLPEFPMADGVPAVLMFASPGARWDFHSPFPIQAIVARIEAGELQATAGILPSQRLHSHPVGQGFPCPMVGKSLARIVLRRSHEG